MMRRFAPSALCAIEPRAWGMLFESRSPSMNERRDDVVRNDKNLFGRDAVRVRPVQELGPNVKRIAARPECDDDGFHASKVLK